MFWVERLEKKLQGGKLFSFSQVNFSDVQNLVFGTGMTPNHFLAIFHMLQVGLLKKRILEKKYLLFCPILWLRFAFSMKL